MSDGPHCGWCGMLAGKAPAHFKITINTQRGEFVARPGGGEMIWLDAPSLGAFVCRPCFKKAFKQCDYIDVEAV